MKQLLIFQRAYGALGRCGRVTVLGVTLASAGPLHAELTWESTTQLIQLEAEQTDGTVTYRFANNTSRDITIVDVRVSCECTEARLDKQIVRPNERGELTLKYHHAEAALRLTRTATVRTSDDLAGSTTLSLDVVAKPRLVTFRPQALIWVRGPSLETKVVKINLKNDEGLELAAIETSSNSFALEKHRSKDGIEVRITPIKRDPIDASLTVTVNRGTRPPLRHSIPLLIR